MNHPYITGNKSERVLNAFSMQKHFFLEQRRSLIGVRSYKVIRSA
jgi:hypothetical protein